MKKTRLVVSTILAIAAAGFTAMAGTLNNNTDANGALAVNGVVQTTASTVTQISDQSYNHIATQAVEAYRNALINNTWNTCGVRAEKFAVVDIFHDGVPEVFALAEDTVHDDREIYFSTILHYNNGLQLIHPDGDERSIFGAVNLEDGRVNADHTTRGYHDLYQFDGVTIIEKDYMSSAHLTEDEYLYKLQNQYANLHGINYVDFTQENLDTYLSGNGMETGVSASGYYDEELSLMTGSYS